MAVDKRVLRFRLTKAKPGGTRGRRTKKGRKRDTHERFVIVNGGGYIAR
jgi:hypothetical protein